MLLLIPGVALGQGLGDFVSPGKLARAHKDLDGITNCSQCHSLGHGVSAELCLDCHTETRSQVVDKQGFHADKGQNCQSCHPDHRGRNFEMVQFETDYFNHDTTGFLLRGAHLEAECEDCHTDTDSWRGLHDDTACLSCHQEDDPHRGDIVGRPLLDDCAACHDTNDWDALPLADKIFNHSDPEYTDYLLDGAHTKVDCEDCHAEWQFVPTAHDQCTDCHRNPHHVRFDEPCASCHGTPSWRVSNFDHDLTPFPLEGEHIEVACDDCHDGHVTRPVEHADCVACHEDVHEGHFAPTECSTCHNPQGWGVEDFDHDRTSFPLEGKHVDAECESCHIDGQWSGIKHETCLDCHDEDNPHNDSMEADSCTTCHWPEGWKNVVFFHATETDFSLQPQHVELECLDCHTDRDHFDGIDMACLSCHESERPPLHYEGDCAVCHPGAHWTPADLGGHNHAVTGFALHGEHARLDCFSCHQPDGSMGEVASTCQSCHTEDDPHRGLLGNRCDDCHNASTWYRTTFRHHQTGWPLRGAHRIAECWDCHPGRYVGTPTDCRVCHESEAPLSIPEHQSAFFQDCEGCHKTYSWSSTLRSTR